MVVSHPMWMLGAKLRSSEEQQMFLTALSSPIKTIHTFKMCKIHSYKENQLNEIQCYEYLKMHDTVTQVCFFVHTLNLRRWQRVIY